MHSTDRPRIDRSDIDKAAEDLNNWGKWGEDDQLGTLNYTSAEDIIRAATLVRQGKVISLGLNFDNNGPQAGRSKFPPVGRFNPIHTMLRTGTDAYSGVLDKRGMRSADDIVIIPSQCATHWDGLAHIFFDNHMWNGYDCREVSSFGAARNGIEQTKEKFVGRGVLLDLPRYLGLDWLPEGFAITTDLLDSCCEAQGVKVGTGDFLLIRTGQMEEKFAAGSWDGYNGGDAPGMAFETLYWLQDKQVAAVAMDTWGCEVRPNESVEGISQPWHWICIPIMGLTMGEIFKLDVLGEECAKTRAYDFLFVAPALPVTGAVGSPINPLAIL